MDTALVQRMSKLFPGLRKENIVDPARSSLLAAISNVGTYAFGAYDEPHGDIGFDETTTNENIITYLKWYRRLDVTLSTSVIGIGSQMPWKVFLKSNSKVHKISETRMFVISSISLFIALSRLLDKAIATHMSFSHMVAVTLKVRLSTIRSTLNTIQPITWC